MLTVLVLVEVTIGAHFSSLISCLQLDGILQRVDIPTDVKLRGTGRADEIFSGKCFLVTHFLL